MYTCLYTKGTKQCLYIISGSKITIPSRGSRTGLRELLFDQNEPFYQHFHLMQISEFSREDALLLLQTLNAEEGREIPVSLCEKMVDILGGNSEPKNLTEIAKQLEIPTGTANAIVGRLLKEDVIVKTDEKKYLIPDKAFALWLKGKTEKRQDG